MSEIGSPPEALYRLEGVIKKKRKDGLIKIMDSSVDRYFCFRCEGRYLCYFEQTAPPVAFSNRKTWNQKPRGVIFVSEITEVIDNYGGKNNHFFVKSNMDDMHLKIDKKEEKDKWVYSLNELRKFHKKGTSDYLDNRKSKTDMLDIHIIHQIMEDQEKSAWVKACAEKDFSKPLKAKKISHYLDLVSPAILNKRLLVGSFKINSGKALKNIAGVLEAEEIPEAAAKFASEGESHPEVEEVMQNQVPAFIQVGDSKVVPKNFMFWEEHFCIMVSSKSMVHEDYEEDMIDMKELPLWMEADTLYLFEYKNEKDGSEFVRKVNGSQMIMIEPFTHPSFQGDYYFMIQTKEDTLFFEVKFASETSAWLNGLRRAKKTREEQMRTKKKQVSRNIDPLVLMFLNKMGKELEEKASGECQAFTDKIREAIENEQSPRSRPDPLVPLKEAREFLSDVRPALPDPRRHPGAPAFLLGPVHPLHEDLPPGLDSSSPDALERELQEVRRTLG